MILGISCAHWPSVYILWRNVCLSTLHLFLSLLLGCKRSLYVLDISPLSNIFLYSVGCLFTFLLVLMHISFKFWSSPITYFFFCCSCFQCQISESIASSEVMKVYLKFSFNTCIVLALVFRLVIHFELMFVYGMR